MAGLIGNNVLTGTVRLWYPWQVDDVMASSLVLDTRSPAEFASGHLPGRSTSRTPNSAGVSTRCARSRPGVLSE